MPVFHVKTSSDACDSCWLVSEFWILSIGNFVQNSGCFSCGEIFFFSDKVAVKWFENGPPFVHGSRWRYGTYSIYICLAGYAALHCWFKRQVLGSIGLSLHERRPLSHSEHCTVWGLYWRPGQWAIWVSQHERFFATLQNGVSMFPCGLLEFMMVAFFDQHLC